MKINFLFFQECISFRHWLSIVYANLINHRGFLLKCGTGSYEYGTKWDSESLVNWMCPRGVMVQPMDGGIVVNEFELQSRYHVHFEQIPLGKVQTPLSSQLWVK